MEECDVPDELSLDSESEPEATADVGE